MSVPIEESRIDIKSLVAPLSRYENSTAIYYSENKLITFKTYIKGLYPASDQDRFMVITEGKAYRPDLVSQQIYGVPDLWWKIMEANNMMDIIDFVAGKTIRIPSNVF